MDFEKFKIKLFNKLKEINIEITEKQASQFYNYMKLLVEWNEKINLTSIIEEDEIILKHFVDSLTVSKYIGKNDKIADIGTGAGFPGIPLKILNSENEFYLIDSLNKRINFLNEVISKNDLKNITAIHSRVEEIGRNNEYRYGFDVVTSRAVAKLNVLLEYMLPLLKIGGKCICLKGPNIEQELEEAQNALKVLGGEIEKVDEIILPGSDNKRTIIIINSVKHSPNIYPRKAGTPTTSPI